jgi:glycosyltransferase involved in cell wall biosynthesis
VKILMLAPQPFFEPRGTPFSVLGRLRALSYLGHEVDLLTYHVGQNVVIPGVTIFRTPAISCIREVPVGPSRIKPFLDVLLFAKAFRLLQKGRYDLLHTHEEACFFGVLLAKFFRLPHLYDMHSSLPQQLRNFRYSRLRPLIGLFEGLERWAINASDALITICPALEEYVKQINTNVPHVMIENVASEGDTAVISEEEMHTFKATHALVPGQKIVLYAGTFEPYQGLDLFIASAERVLCQRQDVLFLLVGGKPEQVRHYQSQVRERGLLSHFRFTGIRPPQDVPCFIRLAHVLVSPRTSGTNTPLKIYAYLQSGKPIVATNLHTHTQVLNPEVAVLVEPAPEALAQGILAVLEDPHFARNLGQQARQLFEQRYSFGTFIQRTDQILQMALR